MAYFQFLNQYFKETLNKEYDYIWCVLNCDRYFDSVEQKLF